ncbi:Acyl-CoA N-acyltransferase [Cynara cardunculus var. scolymus]|uniref:Acyl-CoA N-acyltransferase n=1 Tax=Cynara cardunculus var. scolymus TaxID=59895 RepID=A0A103YNV4_CYNCS|nr:Acyl-CoA N-acyltransferase [Cynara cardunculus var. scolymus]
MKDFPSCFGENGVQVAEASPSSGDPITPTTTTRIAQNLVTCVYQCRMLNSSCFIITITWTKSLMGQSLSVRIDDSDHHSLCKLDIKPWLFSKRRGFRNLEVGSNLAPNGVLISKRAHVFGKKAYSTRAQFCGRGQIHDIVVECDTMGANDSYLLIRIDGNPVMQVKCLRWKFRGNYTILVDGLPVEVYWDVHSWLFEKLMGNAVFLFQTCLSSEKLWSSEDPSWLRAKCKFPFLKSPFRQATTSFIFIHRRIEEKESEMTTIRRFCCDDLLRFSSVNLDHLTETFNMSFYMTYLARWPDYFHVAEAPGNRVMGYIMGKVEGQGESWHGHVTAVTVAPEFRRQQLAKKLMNLLEDISDKIYLQRGHLKLEYIIYRRVLRYYSGEEDGLDMRKALSRDVEKKSIIPLKRPVMPDELEYD